MGNLIPAAVWLVPAIFGIRSIVATHELAGTGLGILAFATGLGWLALNQFGLYQNSRMKIRLTAILGKTAKLPQERFFVGFSSPKFTGVLDAHEDVGFLCLGKDSISFVSETRVVELKRAEVTQVEFRPNVHSMVGLGRWISIEALRSGVRIRMLIEPRERRTMLGNLREGKPLKLALQAWIGQK